MSALDAPPLLHLDGVTKRFPVRSGLLRRVTGWVDAVHDVDLAIGAGETVGLVGESGSGKSTLGRVAIGLLAPTAGTVRYAGQPVVSRTGQATGPAARGIQMVFQDPYSSFDPRLTLARSVGEPIDVHLRLDGPARRRRLEELVEMVGMRPDHLDRYPRELSGGQLQRLSIARALAADPQLVVLDEPVSSLDVSHQAQVLNLLEQLQRDTGVSYLLIAHNPALVRHASERMAVMYLGEIVESGPAGEVHDNPRHPYTQALLSAVAIPEVRDDRPPRIILRGDIPNPTDPPPGCRFHTRCPYAMDVCAVERPEPTVTATGVTVRCHLHTSGPVLGGAPVSVLPRPTPPQLITHPDS